MTRKKAKRPSQTKIYGREVKAIRSRSITPTDSHSKVMGGSGVVRGRGLSPFEASRDSPEQPPVHNFSRDRNQGMPKPKPMFPTRNRRLQSTKQRSLTSKRVTSPKRSRPVSAMHQDLSTRTLKGSQFSAQYTFSKRPQTKRRSKVIDGVIEETKVKMYKTLFDSVDRLWTSSDETRSPGDASKSTASNGFE